MFEWMQEYDVQSYNLDVRRFTSFGVIKVRFPNSKCYSRAHTHYIHRASSVGYIGGLSCFPIQAPHKLSRQAYSRHSAANAARASPFRPPLNVPPAPTQRSHTSAVDPKRLSRPSSPAPGSSPHTPPHPRRLSSRTARGARAQRSRSSRSATARTRAGRPRSSSSSARVSRTASLRV